MGDDVDLSRLPIPIWNELDGGPYITFPCHISRDPETGIRNAAMYRAQVFDRNTVGILAAPYRHINIQGRKQKGPFPVAIALGLDPAIHIASVSAFPFGVDEIAMAGALRQEAVSLVKCETIPLEVPATAEIVLEGELLYDETREEGLFGEFTGYYGIKVERPTIKIKAMTFRNDPIYLGSYEGKPPVSFRQACMKGAANGINMDYRNSFRRIAHGEQKIKGEATQSSTDPIFRLA